MQSRHVGHVRKVRTLHLAVSTNSRTLDAPSSRKPYVTGYGGYLGKRDKKKQIFLGRQT
jgi:hypothetical protein